MSLKYFEDHLSGFSEALTNSILDKFSDESVYTEYILSKDIKKNYTFDIKFFAWLMVRNNHFMKFLDFPEPPTARRTHFLSTFNKSPDPTRKKFIMCLIAANLFDPEVSTKAFGLTHREWIGYFRSLPGSVVSSDLNLKNVANSLECIIHPEPDIPNGSIQEMNNIFADKIADSFITAVCEPVAESYAPFPTEKFCFPIVNKTLWIAYAQPGYHKFLGTKFGIEPYKGIFYDFDNIQNPDQRLYEYIKELTRISKLSPDDKNLLYKNNSHIIQQNFDTVTSGRLVANIWKQDEFCKEFSDLRSIPLDTYQIGEQLIMVARHATNNNLIPGI